MNKKGQALVEFVLILPVFLFLLFSIYDFGMMFTTKNKLESDSSDIVSAFKSNKDIDNIKIKYSDYIIKNGHDQEYYYFKIEKSIKLITPGFNRIFGNPYVVSVERYIPYDE